MSIRPFRLRRDGRWVSTIHKQPYRIPKGARRVPLVRALNAVKHQHHPQYKQTPQADSQFAFPYSATNPSPLSRFLTIPQSDISTTQTTSVMSVARAAQRDMRMVPIRLNPAPQNPNRQAIRANAAAIGWRIRTVVRDLRASDARVESLRTEESQQI